MKTKSKTKQNNTKAKAKIKQTATTKQISAPAIKGDISHNFLVYLIQ